MAIYINCLVGCALREVAETIQGRLSELPFVHRFEDKQLIERDGLWWASILPKGIGLGVPHDSKQDRERYGSKRREIADEIYDVLRSCDSFHIAMMGWEISDRWFDPEDDDQVYLNDVRIPRDLVAHEGLVIADSVLEFLDDDSAFEVFAAGFHWVPLVRADWYVG